MNETVSLVREYQRESANQPADYWFWLARTDVDAELAALLIANIQPGTLLEQGLPSGQKRLFGLARMLIAESGIKAISALEWLRWAVEHPELFLSHSVEKDRLKKILLAVERNPGQQQKEELDNLRQTLEQERVANKELLRKLETTERVCAVAQEESYELRSQAKLDCQIHYLEVNELREKLEQEIRPPLERKLAKLDNELAQTKSLLKQEREDAKERPSYRLLTAALLCLLEEPGRQSGIKQAGIKKTILERFGTWPGLKSRNLDDMFAEANAAEKDAGSSN